jgi:microcystin-dependent protein
MGTSFVGEIRMFGGNFAPAGWAFCNGQLLDISQNSTLFNLIGTTYGGDGTTTFALPDLQGRLPVHQGTGAGLSNRVIGEKSGVETVTLITTQIPSHAHTALGQSATGNQPSPAGNVWAASSLNQFSSSAANVAMNAASIGNSGGSQPHSNFMPYLCINFIISLFGIFPSRN